MAEPSDLFAVMRETAGPSYGPLHWEGSFPSWIRDHLERDPVAHVRTSYQLVRDMLDHFGVETVERDGDRVTHFKLFDDPFEGGRHAIYGLDRVIDRLANAIRAAAKEEGKERLLILNGPVGTAKTSLLDLLCRGLEEYTRLPQGAVYTFSWKFPRRLDEEPALGFGPRPAAGPDDGEPFARIPCQLRDHPLYLIPRPERARYLDAVFARRFPDARTRPPVPRKLLEGDLCYNCQAVLRHLLRRSKGDWEKAVARVVVERFVVSELAGTGVAKVLPEGNAEGGAALLSFDENYKAVATLMWDLTLVRYAGKYVHGNRGIMHYSDIFKKPVVYLQHLLAACEEHKVDFGEVGADVDVLIVGTTNEPEFAALRKTPVAWGLRSRMRRIDVPYLLDYRDERRIYDQALREASRATHVAPHTTGMAALFAVLTRLEKPELEAGEAVPPEAARAASRLTPLQKALCYAGEVPRDLPAEDRRALTIDVVRRLRREHPREGMTGLSTRLVQNLLADICEAGETRCVTPFDLFKGLRRVLGEGAEIHEFLGQPEAGEYHDAPKLLEAVIARYDGLVADEIEQAVVDVPPSELDAKIREYFRHVRAFNVRERVPNPQTGAPEAPDEARMRWVEAAAGVTDEERNEFRFRIVARAAEGVRAGSGALDLRETYRDLYRAVLQGLSRERRQSLNWTRIRRVIERGDAPAPPDESIDQATVRACRMLEQNLTGTSGYCRHCARDAVLYALGKSLVGTRT